MQEIEVIEKTQDVLGLLDMPDEVRERYLRSLEPQLSASETIPILERLLGLTRLSTKSLLPEVNVINALILLAYTRRPFVVGVMNGDHEDETISVPIVFPIEVIAASSSREKGDHRRVMYKTGNPSGKSIRPLYVRVYTGHVPVFSILDVPIPGLTPLPTENILVDDGNWGGQSRTFEVAGLGAVQTNAFFSWVSSRIHDDLRPVYPADHTYPPRRDYRSDERPPIVDSESTSLAKILGSLTSRDFMLPKEIFGSNLGILGYGDFRNALTLDKPYDDLLDALRDRISLATRDREIAEHNEAERYRRATLIEYIHSRLPHDRAHSLLGTLRDDVRADAILGLLKSGEREMITRAIADDEKKLAGIANNPCPHRKAVNGVYLAISADDKKDRLAILSEFIGEKSDDMVSCKKCSFPLLCPHSLVHQTALSEMKNMAEIKALLSGYIYPDKVEGNFVCRICGEIIVGISAFDAVVGDAAIGFLERDEDPEVSELWTNISYLTKYVTFDNLVNRSGFIRAVLNLIWPIVSTMNSKIMSSRGNSAEEIDSKKRLNSAIHIFAAFVYFAIESGRAATSTGDNASDVVRVSLTYDKSTAGASETAKMLNYVVKTITDTMSIHVRRAGGLSPQILANDLLNAYKSIAALKKGAISQAIIADATTDIWLTNSFVWYVADHLFGNDSAENVLRAADELAPFTVANPSAKPSRRAVKVRKFTGLVKHPVMQSRIEAIIPHLPEDIIRRWTVKKVLSSKDRGDKADRRDDDKGDKKGSRDDGDRSWPKGKPKALNTFMTPLHTAAAEMYSSYTKAAFPVVYELTTNAYASFGDEEKRKAYYATAPIVTFGIAEKLAQRMMRYMWCRISHPIQFTRRYYLPQVATLDMMYTDDGKKRVWVRFGKYTRPAGKKGPWTYDDSYKGEAIDGGRPMWMDTTGYVLSPPKYNVSRIDAPTDKGMMVDVNARVRKAIIARERSKNILSFYEFICPLGDQHAFVDGKCSKCAYEMGGENASFVGTYAKKYDEDQAILNPPPTASKVIAYVPPKRQPVTVKPVDFALLAEAAKFCNVSTNVIAALGAYDGIPYKTITDGSYHAPVTTSRMAARPDKLRMACINLIARYGSFVNIANDHRPSREILDVVGDVRVPKGILSLDDFADSFVEEYENVYKNNSVKDLVDFTLGRFVTMILKLRDVEREHAALKGIIAWVIAGALADERLSTKPVITSWASILKAQKDDVDSNTDDNTGAVHENENEDDETGDGMDVDFEDGDGDGSNQIKVRDE